MKNQNIINEEKGNDVNHVLAAAPFNLSEIDDVRIIISAKGKNYGIVANKEKCAKEDLDAKQVRLALLSVILKIHDIVTPALEDINPEKLKSKL
jgi:hypothetical protein